MSDTPTHSSGIPVAQQPGSGERVVYIVPENPAGSAALDEIDLGELVRSLWSIRYWGIGGAAVFAILGAVYAFLATPWYRAEVLLAPIGQDAATAIGGSLGGLASLAGINVGGSDSVNEAIGVLQSRSFARSFIEDNELTPMFFQNDWDADRNTWRRADPSDRPDVRDAVDLFHNDIMFVAQDQQTSMVTIRIEWTDPDLAARWGNELAMRLNRQMRDRALAEAEANIAFLREELAAANIVTLQQSVGRLLESEMQKLMLARGSEEFAFRVIDSALGPKYPERPNKPLIIVLSTILGGLFGFIWIFLVRILRPST